MTRTEENAYAILSYLAKRARDQGATGQDIADATELFPDDINDTVRLLVSADLAGWLQTFGTAPFDFREVEITSRGRYELERAEEVAASDSPLVSESGSASASASAMADATRLRPPSPVGSPYGFDDEDWEVVARRKADMSSLNVVLGMQLESERWKTA